MDHVDRPRRPRWLVAAAAGGALVLLAGMAFLVDVRLRAAREDGARQVVTAAARGDCARVAAAYRDATSGLVIPGRRPRVAADVTRLATDCREVTQADALRTSGRLTAALGEYLEFRRRHVFSPLYEPVRRRIQDLVHEPALRTEPETCRLVARAVANENLPGPVVDARPALLTGCGELLATSGDRKIGGDRDVAHSLVNMVRRKHGGSPEARRAEVTEAALLVDYVHLPDDIWMPRRTGTGTGHARLLLGNPGRKGLTFAISGPGGGRVVQIDRCPAWPVLDADDDRAGCGVAGKPEPVLTLPPGTYRVYLSIDGPDGGDRWTGTWKLRPGTYANCLASPG